MGVRFVSINDGLDNEDENSNTDALIVSLKNLINDVYAKDISQKTISSLRTKQQNGEYIGGLPPYGYTKSEHDHHKLVIDEEVAPVVRDIFRWKADGMGDTIIARRLNEMGIPSPAKRHIDKGDIKKTEKYKVFLWCDRAIRMITINPMYIGHMTQGRTRQALCDNMPSKEQPKSEWIIVENTHAPIVDAETFEKAQEARANNTSAFYKNYDKSKHISSESYLFKGLLFCNDCGSKLLRIKNISSNNSVSYSFVCPVKKRNLGLDCSHKNVHDTVFYDTALKSIKYQIDTATNLSAIIERLNKAQSANKPKDSIAERMSHMQKELKRLTNLKASLYETYADKLLSENEYIYSKQKYEKEIADIKQKLAVLQEESVMKSETLTPKNKWVQVFKRFTDHDELSYEMVKALVKKVIVKNNTDFEFVWNFKNEYDALREYTEVSK